MLLAKIEQIEDDNHEQKIVSRRTKTQDTLVYTILWVIVGLTIFVTLSEAIFGLDSASIGLVKDVILIIASSFGTAIGTIYAVEKVKSSNVSRTRTKPSNR